MIDFWLAPIDPFRPHDVGFLLSWHGRAMFAAWAVLAPVGVIAARYFKVTPGQDWPRELDNPFWWRLHRGAQYAALVLTFAAFALASIPLWRRFSRGDETAADQPFLNRRADAFVGREFTLEKPIVSGNGTVRIDDTIWRLAGPDSPAGSKVKVVRADAAMLVVEKV